MKNVVLELANESVFFTKTIKRLYPEVYKMVLDTFPGSKPVEKFWNYANDNYEIPKCIMCSKQVPFGKSFSAGYQLHCSQRCSQLNPNTRDKIKSSNLERFGVEHNMQHSHSLELRKQTWLRNLGVDNPGKSKECIEKGNSTFFNKRGTYCRWESAKDTVLERYGVENVMHIPSIAQKVLLSNKKTKPYSLPSGKIVHVQGYEKFAINILIDAYSEDELKIHTDVPTIRYEFNGTKIHYPDIFIPKDNLIIEVKSDYTLLADLEKNRAKMHSAIQQGYRYEFWVFGRNQEELKIYTSLDQM